MTVTLAERLRRFETVNAARATIATAPIRLRPDNLVERPWGGRWLAEFKQLGERERKFGESFELAADPNDPEARSHPSQVVFADGSTMPLPELLELAGAELLGEAFVHAYGPSIPLLPKLLDVEGLLSVQTHPAGNPELYVIVDAEPGATLRLGWRRAVDPVELSERFAAGRAVQERMLELLRADIDLDQVQRSFARVLGRERVGLDQAHANAQTIVATLAKSLRPDASAEQLLELVTRAVELHHEVLDRMNVLPIGPGQVIYNARPSAAQSSTVPSAEVHALGDPSGKRALIFEVRRPGVTHRAWDHVRFPLRPLDIAAAFATMSCAASQPEQFRVELRPLPGRPGVRRSVECPAFVVDHLQPTPAQAIEIRSAGLPVSLHGLRGEVELIGLERESLGRLRAGESLLLPHAHAAFVVHARTPPCELLQITMPIDPTRAAAAAKRSNWSALATIVARSLGPRELLAIVNGGDGPTIASHLERMTKQIFRADGATTIIVHEESTRRGQLLGLLDMLDEHPLDPDHVALGIMLPGKGTRMSPLTQRLRGIKPLMPVPIRPSTADPGQAGPWLDAATASLHSWVLVTHTLERLGFRGVAWKWGDEPQIPARVLAELDRDLSEVDAVRFGADVEVDDDLARNKEWLGVDPASHELTIQVRRRPLAELRERLGARPDQPLRAQVNLGSPAFSHRFLAHADRWFGDCADWLDVDGYLFEALTHDAPSWAAEIARDQELRALLERVPDFYTRARGLRATLEAERGHPLRVAVIDFGSALHWCDVGQLGKTREAFAALVSATGETGEFARVLAGLAAIEPDRWGNRIAGQSTIPDDGSIRDCVIVDASIGSGHAQQAVILRSAIGQARLGPGSVAIDCKVDQLELGPNALAFGSQIADLSVCAGWVHTSIPADPQIDAGPLESWWADSQENPGARDNYEQVVWGNPASFAAKFEQMRRRG